VASALKDGKSSFRDQFNELVTYLNRSPLWYIRQSANRIFFSTQSHPGSECQIADMGNLRFELSGSSIAAGAMRINNNALW
jgi:hypothetical protein